MTNTEDILSRLREYGLIKMISAVKCVTINGNFDFKIARGISKFVEGVRNRLLVNYYESICTRASKRFVIGDSRLWLEQM